MKKRESFNNKWGFVLACIKIQHFHKKPFRITAIAN